MKEVQVILGSDHTLFSRLPHETIVVKTSVEDRSISFTTTWYKLALSSWLDAYYIDNLQPAWEMFYRGPE